MLNQSHKISRLRQRSQDNENRNPHATFDGIASQYGSEFVSDMFGPRENYWPGDIKGMSRGPKSDRWDRS